MEILQFYLCCFAIFHTCSRKVSDALTGVHLRTSTLPDPGVSGLQNHRVGPEPFAIIDESTRTINTSDTDDHAVRKCVYNYEDKYTFARILQNDSLIFDSHFESGNLHSAFRVFPPAGGSGASAVGSLSLHAENIKKAPTCFLKHQTYDLYMHNDCFTHGHTQWFYFSVKNVVVGQAVIFNIKNFTKSESLFTEGMRPLLLSTKSKRGWVRAGTSIKYCYSAGNNNNTNSSISDNFQPISQNVQPGHSPSPSLQTVDGSNVQAGGPSNKKDGKECLSDNPIKAPSSVQSKQQQQQTISQSSKPGSYALTFSHTFEFSEDLCYFAYCLPYTYTDLRKYLNAMEATPARSKFVRRTELCRTLAGNSCDLLTITAPSRTPKELNNRVGVVFTARVHPGESNASWIMQGILDCLTADNPVAAALREQYVFKIVPMLNPDGVINGNYRCSLAGVDLNRRWNNPDIYYHPTVYHTKQLILRMKKLRAVGLIVDIHGHSLKQGAFFYGCSPEKRLLRLRSCSPPLSISPVPTRAGGQRDRSNNIRDTEGPATATSSSSSAMDIQEEHIKAPESGVQLEGSIAVAPIKSTDSTIFDVSDCGSSNKDKDVMICSMAVVEGPLDSNPIIYSPTSLTEVGTSTSDDKQLGDQAAVGVNALYPPTPRGLQLPTKKSSLRDLLSWRVHLFPRICTALAPLFAAESCSFKLQKAKASTFRMVAFTELGVDCVYTLEASLAGLAPYHFGAQDLLRIGEELCRGLIVAHPSVSATDACIHKTSTITPQVAPLTALSGVPSLPPSYDRCGSEPHMLNRFRSILGLAEGRKEGDIPILDKSIMIGNVGSGAVSSPSQDSIAPFLLEMQDWRPLYINNRDMHHTGIACRVLSELGMSEITITAATELEDLSDEDDDPEKITTTAFGRTNRPDVTGGKDKDKRKCSLKSLKVPILFRERAPSAPLITCSIGEIGPIAYLDAGVVEGLFAPEQRKQQRDRERKVTPISQPRRRSCGNFPVNMIYSSLLPKQTPVGSGKDVEVEIDMSKERDRIKGRMRGAGAFHSTPHSDRKAEEAVIISLTPSIQQLLQPSAGQDPILHVTPSKKDKESGSVMASTTGNAPTSTPRRRPRLDTPTEGVVPGRGEVSSLVPMKNMMKSLVTYNQGRHYP